MWIWIIVIFVLFCFISKFILCSIPNNWCFEWRPNGYVLRECISLFHFQILWCGKFAWIPHKIGSWMRSTPIIGRKTFHRNCAYCVCTLRFRLSDLIRIWNSHSFLQIQRLWLWLWLVLHSFECPLLQKIPNPYYWPFVHAVGQPNVDQNGFGFLHSEECSRLMPCNVSADTSCPLWRHNNLKGIESECCVGFMKKSFLYTMIARQSSSHKCVVNLIASAPWPK